MIDAIGRDLVLVALVLLVSLLLHAVLPGDPVFREMSSGAFGALLALVQRDIRGTKS